MAKFASFRKCDFQIHTPRDPGWRGSRPIGLKDTKSDGKSATADDVHRERTQWAKQFVDSCLERNLEAIAITDHHETVMVKYIVAEIEARTESDNAADLWVFPAMELTVKDGAQALLLFDADLPEEKWSQARTVLGIDHSDDDIYKATAPHPKQLSYTYDELAGRLDTIESLRNRYIVLPNVSDGGHSVVRKGWGERFRKMPYVGGYMDAGQTINNCSPTLRRRLSGDDTHWGDRFIYPLPTSDSREAGFPKLGTNNAWIKLSAPSAESVRQAFLAHQSRIQIEAPSQPNAGERAGRGREY